MFNIVEKRRWFFLISAAFILPGLVAMIYSTLTTGSPFRLGIDFVGGSIYDFQFVEDGATEAGIRTVFAQFGDENVVIQQLDARSAPSLVHFLAIVPKILSAIEPEGTRWSVRTVINDDDTRVAVFAALDEQVAAVDTNPQNLSFSQVSATVGQEVTRAAIFAVIAGAVVITSFIVLAFRQVPNAFRYGACAIVAMIHDALVVMGVMSIAGAAFGWEVDALFLTALLTVIGFSVQDSIVVFDRIRENIPKHLGEPYETIVNRSLWETVHRSLATQLNAFFIMAAILLFGGDTIKQFIAILFIGLLSGTYSSIFNAVPLLVAWEKGEIPFLKGGTAAGNVKRAEAL